MNYSFDYFTETIESIKLVRNNYDIVAFKKVISQITPSSEDREPKKPKKKIGFKTRNMCMSL